MENNNPLSEGEHTLDSLRTQLRLTEALVRSLEAQLQQSDAELARWRANCLSERAKSNYLLASVHVSHQQLLDNSLQPVVLPLPRPTPTQSHTDASGPFRTAEGYRQSLNPGPAGPVASSSGIPTTLRQSPVNTAARVGTNTPRAVLANFQPSEGRLLITPDAARQHMREALSPSQTRYTEEMYTAVGDYCSECTFGDLDYIKSNMPSRARGEPAITKKRAYRWWLDHNMEDHSGLYDRYCCVGSSSCGNETHWYPTDMENDELLEIQCKIPNCKYSRPVFRSRLERLEGMRLQAESNTCSRGHGLRYICQDYYSTDRETEMQREKNAEWAKGVRSWAERGIAPEMAGTVNSTIVAQPLDPERGDGWDPNDDLDQLDALLRGVDTLPEDDAASDGVENDGEELLEDDPDDMDYSPTGST